MADSVPPRAVQAFIDSTNRADCTAFLEAFTHDAVVDDWGRASRGRDGIASWNDTDNIGVQAHFELLGIRQAQQGRHVRGDPGRDRQRLQRHRADDVRPRRRQDRPPHDRTRPVAGRAHRDERHRRRMLSAVTKATQTDSAGRPGQTEGKEADDQPIRALPHRPSAPEGAENLCYPGGGARQAGGRAGRTARLDRRAGRIVYVSISAPSSCL